MPETLFAFGLNHKTAPVEVREKLFVSETELPELSARLKSTLKECLILSTCNRTEVYCVADAEVIDPDFYKRQLIDFKAAHDFVRDEHFFTLLSCSACRQLFNVATSIDSKIVGDSQILKQVRAAYAAAGQTGTAGSILNQLAQRALKLGKRSFSETSIHDGAVSVSLAAVEMAVETFGSIRGRSVMIVGAGETARLTAEALVNKRVGKLIVVNRTPSHAAELLSALRAMSGFEAEIVDFQNFREHLADAEIVITSTGSTDPILSAADFDALNRRVLLIDIAVPRDIDPAVTENPRVVLKNIDDLHSIIGVNRERRLIDLPRVKRLIADEMADFLVWYYARPLIPTESASERRVDDFKRAKTFLHANLSEIHKLAGRSTGNFKADFDDHLALVRSLRSRAALFAEAGQ